MSTPIRHLSAAAALIATVALLGCGGPRQPEATSAPAPSTTPAATSTTPSPTSTTREPCPTPPDTPRTGAPAAGHPKTVALTFDDGPGAVTLQVGELLKQNQVRATFFLTGKHHQDNPGETAQLAGQGHLIANHSFDHRYPGQVPGGWTLPYVTQQLRDTNTALAEASGQSICWFRPPGGFTTNVKAATSELGMGIAMWDVDSMDWKQTATTTEAATQAIVTASTTVTSGNPNHPMVLLHTAKASREPESAVHRNRTNTLAALPAIIEWYRARGYVFVDLDGRTAP